MTLQGAKVSPFRHELTWHGRVAAVQVRNGLPVERAYLWRGSPKLAELNAAIMAARAAQAPPPPRFTDCGTPAAYRRHRKLREAPCTACRKAAAEQRARYGRRSALCAPNAPPASGRWPGGCAPTSVPMTM